MPNTPAADDDDPTDLPPYQALDPIVLSGMPRDELEGRVRLLEEMATLQRETINECHRTYREMKRTQKALYVQRDLLVDKIRIIGDACSNILASFEGD